MDTDSISGGVSYKKRIFLGVLACLVFGAVFVAIEGYYPAAIVNGHLISVRRHRVSYNVSSAYYRNLATYIPGSPTSTPPGVNELEVRAVALDKLIADELIAEAVRKDAGDGLDYLVSEKIRARSGEAGIKKAAATLYNMRWEDFEREVLASEALRDILAGQLFLKGMRASDWFAKTRASAGVVIFSPTLRWDGTQVVVKK